MNKEQLKEKDKYIKILYENTFNSEDGKKIIKDLEEFILKKPIWHCGDPVNDAVMRDGARQLLCFIYEQSNKNNE